jgi:hypothetical protein
MPAKRTQFEGLEFSPGRATARILFRRFRDDGDFAVLSDIGVRSWSADHVDFLKTSEDFKNAFEDNPTRETLRKSC